MRRLRVRSVELATPNAAFRCSLRPVAPAQSKAAVAVLVARAVAAARAVLVGGISPNICRPVKVRGVLVTRTPRFVLHKVKPQVTFVILQFLTTYLLPIFRKMPLLVPRLLRFFFQLSVC